MEQNCSVLQDFIDCGASSGAPFFFVRPLHAWWCLNGLHRKQASEVLKAAGGSAKRAALAYALVSRNHGKTTLDLAFLTSKLQHGARMLHAAYLLEMPAPPIALLRRLALEHARVDLIQKKVFPQLNLVVTPSDLVQQLHFQDNRGDKISLLGQWLQQADASQITQTQSMFMADTSLRSLWQDPSIAGHPKGLVHTRQAELAKQVQKQYGNSTSYWDPDRRPLEAKDLITEQAAVNALSYGQWVSEMPEVLKLMRRYDDNLLRSIRDQAPSAADWQQAKAGLVSAGVYVPPDARLDLVLPYKPIVLVQESSLWRTVGLVVAGTEQHVQGLDFREAALLARASPRDEWTRRIGYNGYPEELHRTLVWAAQNPLQALQEAYPELTQAQLQKIMLNPKERYPKVGVEPLLSGVNLGFDKKSGFVLQTDGSMVIPAGVLNEKFWADRQQVRKTDGQAVPSFVFRGDKRPPNEVQQAGGLYGHSNNASLGMHIFNKGRVPYRNSESSSAFVSFTGNFYVAVDFAASGVYFSDEARYIYVVKPGALISKDAAMPGGGKLGFSGKDENEFTSFGCANEQIVGYYELRNVAGAAHISPLLDFRTGQPVPRRQHPPRDKKALP